MWTHISCLSLFHNQGTQEIVTKRSKVKWNEKIIKSYSQVIATYFNIIMQVFLFSLLLLQNIRQQMQVKILKPWDGKSKYYG